MAKFKFKLKYLNPRNNFSEKEIKWFSRIAIGTVILFLAIYIPYAGYRNYEIKEKIDFEQRFEKESSLGIENNPKVNDFFFPGNFLSFKANPIPSRSSDRKWTADDTERYWVKPEDSGIRDLPARNNDLLRAFLDKTAEGDPNF